MIQLFGTSCCQSLLQMLQWSINRNRRHRTLHLRPVDAAPSQKAAFGAVLGGGSDADPGGPGPARLEAVRPVLAGRLRVDESEVAI